MDRHWSDGYYGDLYRESVEGLLGPELSAHEAGVIRRLLALGPADRVLDLACGEGRHARVLSPGVASLVGLERDPASVDRARREGLAVVRGDLRAPPLRPGRFDAVYSWYASLFMYDDPENERVLAAAVALLRPGGRILVHHANPARMAREPRAQAARPLPGGGRVEEDSTWDAARGRDSCTRRVIRPDGTMLAGVAELRYYNPLEWQALAGRCGLRDLHITSTWQADRPAARLDDDAPDLIAIGRRPA